MALAAQDESFFRHKQYFQSFLENEEDGVVNYVEKIKVMMNERSNRLIVDLNDLRSYDNEQVDSGELNIVSRMLQSPVEYIPPFEDAVKEMVLLVDGNYGEKTHHQLTFLVGFEGSLGGNEVTPRGLLASLLCEMVAVMGIVTKCSAVRPKVVKSVHYCPATNEVMAREYRDGTSLDGLPTTSVYPTKDMEGNRLETEYGHCQYKDYQVITIQEAPETAPLGQLPRSVDVIVEHDLVDKCKPGDRVQAIGCYRALGGVMKAKTSGVFRTMVIANNVQVLGKEIQGIVMTTADLLHVRDVAKREDIFQILGRSIAPSIYGHAMIKQALLLQLLGGVEKNLDNGTHLRGDINVLMVGDPSTAKSQLLRFVRNLAPLAVNTTGRGSSGVGLTAAVTRDTDTNERRLEAGAMVLADRGIVCIDEFDKMSEADRVAIHEVMEQQTVTIAKAGIHATLNARCSVLAAANPVYGQYNKNKKPQENIGLPDSLLSRFDLLFVVLDKLDRTMDRRISDHVIRIHRYQRSGQEGIPISLSVSACNDFHMQDDANVDENEDGTPMWQKYNPVLHGARSNTDTSGYEDVFSMEFMKKYIFYAKTRFNPKLTDAAIETISMGYAELRSEQNSRTLPVTARSLETLIRLSAAHAKARLSNDIEEADANKAMELMKFALYHATSDEKLHIRNNVASMEDEHLESDADLSQSQVSFKDSAEETPRKKQRNDEQPQDVENVEPESLEALIMKFLIKFKNESAENEMDGMSLTDLLKQLNSGSRRFTEKKVIAMLTEMEERNLLLYQALNQQIILIDV